MIENSKTQLATRLALLSIANHADRLGEKAWPSYETIAIEAGITRRNAIYAVQKAIGSGELVLVRQGDRIFPNEYAIPAVRFWLNSGGGEKFAPPQPLGVVKNPTGGGVAATPERVIQQERKNTFMVEALVEAWNQNRGSMAECRLVTEGRRRHGLARLREVPELDRWSAAVQRAAKSKFCTGQVEPQNGHRRFTGNIDWFLRPETLAKIEEGYYDDDRLARKTPGTFAEYLESTATSSGTER